MCRVQLFSASASPPKFIDRWKAIYYFGSVECIIIGTSTHPLSLPPSFAFICTTYDHISSTSLFLSRKAGITRVLVLHSCGVSNPRKLHMPTTLCDVDYSYVVSTPLPYMSAYCLFFTMHTYTCCYRLHILPNSISLKWNDLPPAQLRVCISLL